MRNKEQTLQIMVGLREIIRPYLIVREISGVCFGEPSTFGNRLLYPCVQNETIILPTDYSGPHKSVPYKDVGGSMSNGNIDVNLPLS